METKDLIQRNVELYDRIRPYLLYLRYLRDYKGLSDSRIQPHSDKFIVSISEQIVSSLGHDLDYKVL